MGWYNEIKSPKLKSSKRVNVDTPSGIWKKCTECSEILQSSRLEENLNVCPYCDYHFRINAKERLAMLVDTGSFEEFACNLASSDPLNFHDKRAYAQRLKEAKEKSGAWDGVICGRGLIHERPVSVAIMDFSFMGGSMGVVTGEKIAIAIDYACDNNLPVVVVSCSGGARMQEGILSLMQMAKTSASLARLKTKGLPYISVLTDPTTGGVAASFAMLGDINLAEPNALVGFAGPRVIEQTIRQTLPEGFQRSEFLLEHGFVDRIVARKDLKKELGFFLSMFTHS